MLQIWNKNDCLDNEQKKTISVLFLPHLLQCIHKLEACFDEARVDGCGFNDIVNALVV